MRSHGVISLLMIVLAALVLGPTARAQVNSVNLSGTVTDPQNLPVAGAKVAAMDAATGATRNSATDAEGRYQVLGLPPGHYSLSVDAKGFVKVINPDLVLTLGVDAIYNAHLAIQSGQQAVTVSGQPELIETRRSSVSETITQTQIADLPINGRNYIDFTLLDSQAARDSAPSIGAAPTSGLNFGGQRARSNEVSVDGADAVDNSINGVRSTVSQEAVQEFQLITSNYMPEFGRATGGVVNIVTKSGSNQTHGDIFGFLRHKSIQARNPFSVVGSVQTDPSTGVITGVTETPVKQPSTRVQAGATIGGPIQKDKTFYFFSYETTRRQETGFTDIGSDTFGLTSTGIPCIPIPLLLTSGPTGQAAFYGSTINALSMGGANCAAAAPVIQAAELAGAASATALVGNAPGGPAAFPLPIDCNPAIPGNCTAANVVPLPASFVPLTSLIGNYPVKEGTSLWSLRLDHLWNPKNSTFVRAGISPSLITGIQVNAQNQNFGENAGSRTSLQQTRDWSIVGQHDTSISDAMFNEFRYQFARRGLHYGFSQLPGGSGVGEDIIGFAFFGREPFSTVDRIERRNQWSDNLSWTQGRHNLKVGGDVNLIQVRSNSNQIFQLDYGGRFDFGGISAATLGLPGTFPAFSAVQAYGLGLPGDFLQGAGSSGTPFDNKTLGVFAQDSWKISRRFTLNYGVRYDIEWTPTFRPSTQTNAIAEPALGVLEGIPVDSNNVQPRIGFAWDPTGGGKTVIRGGYGIFFDHPLLAVAFDSRTADGALSSQLIFVPGAATRMPVASNPNALNAASIFQGVLNVSGIPGVTYLPSQQRFDPLNSPLFTNQNYLTAGIPLSILPFTFPVARSFVYAYAQQGGLTIEHQFRSDFKVGVTYSYTHGVHLNRARNINATNPTLLVRNFANALAAGVIATSPLSVVVPGSSSGGTPSTCGLTVIVPNALGLITPGSCPAPLASLEGQFVGTAAVFNFFRPSGPSPSFASIPGVGCTSASISALQGLAATAGFPTGPAGVCVPWSDVVQQESSGNSLYNGFTLTVSKRFSHHFELFSNWTWSHAIDDSTDLQSLLEPQDNALPQLERGNSTFDQRHRWVTSAVFFSPYRTSDSGWYRKFLADFTLDPIIEVSSGRPFTILTGTDFNLDFSSNTDRPSAIRASGSLPPGAVISPFVSGVAFLPPTSHCPSLLPAQSAVLAGALGPAAGFLGCIGDLARNAQYRPGFFTMDLRLSRRFPISERWSFDVIAEGFNLLNRFNVADVDLLCDPTTGSGTCNAGQPTATLDPRQFQFALKLNF